jgi:hypothetical protein
LLAGIWSNDANRFEEVNYIPDSEGFTFDQTTDLFPQEPSHPLHPGSLVSPVISANSSHGDQSVGQSWMAEGTSFPDF